MSQKTQIVTPQSISIDDYIYDLPEHRIAKYPLKTRDKSKLLVYQKGEIQTKVFNEVGSYLSSSDCLVFNDTRVIHARIFFELPQGSIVEIFCLEPISPVEVTESFACSQTCTWKVMIGNARKLKNRPVIDKVIVTPTSSYTLKAEVVSRDNGTFTVSFYWDGGKAFSEVLEDVGTLPIPPYLNRDSEKEDEERYQTVYAQADGSVAAPTAGLHFTQNVFNDLYHRGVQMAFATLHVGAGTFKPVKSDTMAGHEMHRERIQVSVQTIEKLLDAADKGRIVSVGTTSLRTIESIYWFGVKLNQDKRISAFSISQWEPYELQNSAIPSKQALINVLEWLTNNKLSYLSGATQILIAPGYDIKLANALITNFHQPKSTLLLLIAAFVGEDWRAIYQYALRNNFRFLSFGDSSLLIR